MYTFLQQAHSAWAYFVIVLILIAIGAAVFSWASGKPYRAVHYKLAFFALISVYIQAGAGVILYFISPVSQAGMAHFGQAMKNADLRLIVLEHPFVGVFATLIMTMGYYCLGKATCDRDRYKRVAISFSLALALILSRLPYSLWF